MPKLPLDVAKARLKKEDRKIQVRSDNCAIVTIGVSFNVLDSDELEMLNYVDENGNNVSGFVKNCIQLVRKGNVTEQTVQQLLSMLSSAQIVGYSSGLEAPPANFDPLAEYSEITEDEAINDVL